MNSVDSRISTLTGREVNEMTTRQYVGPYVSAPAAGDVMKLIGW